MRSTRHNNQDGASFAACLAPRPMAVLRPLKSFTVLACCYVRGHDFPELFPVAGTPGHDNAVLSTVSMQNQGCLGNPFRRRGRTAIFAGGCTATMLHTSYAFYARSRHLFSRFFVDFVAWMT